MVTFDAEVVHVVAPDELDDNDLAPSLARLAEERYVLVCRRGGKPSFFEKLVAFVRRDPIDAVTVVSDDGFEEGDEVAVTAEETEIAGVYDASDVRETDS